VHNSPFKPGSSNPVPTPILKISKTANPPSGSDVSAGQTIVYTIHYQNEGTGDLTNVVITDVVDPNLTNITPLDGGTLSGSTVAWSVGTIAAGTSGTVSFTAVVDPLPDVTKLYNYATFTSPDLSTPAATNTTEHNIVAMPALAVCAVLVGT